MIYKPGTSAGLFYCQNFEVLQQLQNNDIINVIVFQNLYQNGRGEGV